MSFNQAYKFQVSGKEVVVQHPHNGHIRVSPNNRTIADGGGAMGQFARWRIHLEGGRHCRLQSINTGKYLRLWRGGREIDVNGGTGPFTRFKIHYFSRPNGVKLESDRFPGRYIAVNPNRTMKIGSGGPHCNLWIKREGVIHVKPVHKPPVIIQQQPQVKIIQQGGAGFNAPYMFRQNNVVVVRSNYGKHLRVHPNNQYNADGNGGTGKYAQWRVILDGMGVIKLQNTHTGKYLRIERNNAVNVGGTGGGLTRFRYHTFQSPNGVKLESCKFPGKYIAIRQNGAVMHGSGGIHCKLSLYRQGGQQQKVIVQQPRQQPTVIVQQPAQPQVIVQQPSTNYAQQQAQQQLAQQQAQMAAQQQAQQAQITAQQQQMQQQMEQMRLQNEASMQQQQQQIALEKQKLEQEMAMKQQQMNMQQQQILQQQASLSQSALSNVSSNSQQQIQSPQSQQEGINNAPINPYYGNNASNTTEEPPSYPVLKPVEPVQAEQVEEKQSDIVPVKGADAANEVLQWLTKLNMERYYKTFIENGYDTLDSVAEITREDLKEMGVALGHIKVIIAASLMAPFINKRVKLKSVSHNTYIHEYGKPHKHKDPPPSGGIRCILQHNDKQNLPGCIWIFEMLEDNYFALKHEPTGSFLRLMNGGQEIDTRSPFASDCEMLMLEKHESMKGVYFIKEVTKELYVQCEKPRSLGYNQVKSVEKRDNECRFELKIIH